MLLKNSKDQFELYHCAKYLKRYKDYHFKASTIKVIHFFHSDEQPQLNLENDYPNKTGYNLKTNSSISIL